MRNHWLTLSLLALSAQLVNAEPAPVLSAERDVDGRLLPFGRAKYQPNDAPLGSGPYKAIMVEDSSLTNHTLYYPANMDAAGKLPVIVWGNGGCLNAGNRFRLFLTEIASHGFIVIAGGAVYNTKYEVGPQEQPGVPAPTPMSPLPAGYDDAAYNNAVGRNTAEQMVEGIDWAMKENERVGSKFYHKLDTSKIGVAGQSCGGSLAITVSADPRTSASIFFMAAGGGGGGRRGGGATTNAASSTATNTTPAPGALAANPRLDALHAPVLIITGDAQGDVAYQGGVSTAAYLTKIPMFHGWQEKLTHIGTFGMPNGGQMGSLAWQWFAWHLRGEQEAAKTFKGANCALCVEAGWHVQKKRID